MRRLEFSVIAAAFACGAMVGAPAVKAQDRVGEEPQGVWEGTKEGLRTTGETIERGAEATGHAVKEGAVATGEAIQGAARTGTDALGITDPDTVAAYDRNKLGQHTISGRITDIDRETGRVDIDTDATDLQVFFPKPTLDRLQEGENVNVSLAFVRLPLAETESAAADTTDRQAGTTERQLARAYDAPGLGAESHWMTGSVDSIDHDDGTVELEGQEGRTLNLNFPPQALQGVDEGDRIAVQLAIVSPAGTGSQQNIGTGAAERAGDAPGYERMDAQEPGKMDVYDDESDADRQ